MEGDAERLVSAVGDRSAAIGGNAVHSVVITGNNTVVHQTTASHAPASPVPGEGHAPAQGNGDDSAKGKRTSKSGRETTTARTSETTGKRAPRPFTELRRLFAYSWGSRSSVSPPWCRRC